MSKTIREIIETMNDEQQRALYALVETAMDDVDDDDMEHSDFDADDMEHSDFDAEEALETIFKDARRNGSLKDAFLEHADKYGIKEIEQLFPSEKSTSSRPHFVDNRSEWVNHILKNVHKLPFSRVKTMFSDISTDTLHARGYTKTHKKVEDVISLLKRTTEPTTIYKKGKLDRDDVLDITDFDVVSWIKEEMRMKLDEEIARTILIGDGRDSADEFKIDEECIRPIYNDDDLFAVKVDINDTEGSNRYKNIISALVRSRKLYRGSGTPDLYTTDDVVAELLLLEDSSGHFIYKSEEELKSILRVKDIIIVNEMNGLTREDEEGNKKSVYGIITNIADYAIGADKGGQVAMFDDFDIDYNQQKFLMETRCSGSLLKPYSALVIEGKFNGTSRPIVQGPPSDSIISLNRYVSGVAQTATANDIYIIAEFPKCNRTVESASVQWKVKLLSEGSNVSATKVQSQVFATNTYGALNFGGGYQYTTTASLAEPVEFDRLYTFDVEIPINSGASSNNLITNFKYIKPTLKFTKSTSGEDKYLAFELVSCILKINNVEHDITLAVANGPAPSSNKGVMNKIVDYEGPQPYAGLKAGCIGNSITFGMVPSGAQTDQAYCTWVEQLKGICGFSQAINYGKSGDTMANRSGSTSVFSRLSSMDKDLDVITVFAGVNDWMVNTTLGNIDSTDTSTFYGALNSIQTTLKTTYPNARIMFILPLDRNQINGKPKGINAQDNNLEYYREAIRKVSNKFGIHVYDLQADLPFSFFNVEDNDKYSGDGLHPNQEGINHLANCIGNEINTNLL